MGQFLLFYRYGEFIPAGLEYLSTLCDNYHYKPTINVLSCVVPLFFKSPNVLMENERYVNC